VAKMKAPEVLEVEGARGGSYVRLEQTETEGVCRIEVGHSCVRTVSQNIPVTWLAAILTHAKDIGFTAAMGDAEKFPADYALMCDPEGKRQ
jgi:hypothetical protein